MRSVLYYLFFVIFTLLYFIPFSLLFFVTVWFDKKRVVIHKASRGWAAGIFWLCPWWHLRVEGVEKIDPEKAWVIITNHQSMLDIPLMYVLPANFKWVSKKEVQKIPIFGWVLWMHGDISIERGSRSSTKQMTILCRRQLDQGVSVIIFPEGTRTKTGEVGRFKEGAFFVAKQAGVGVQPVVIDGTWSLNDGWRLRMPHTIRVRVLDSLSAAYVASKEPRELAAETEALIHSQHSLF